jgi:predicted membrane protein
MACDNEPRPGTRRFSAGLLIGLSIIGWGVAILLHQMGIVGDRIFGLWPIILVVFGLANLFEDGRGGRHVWGIVMLTCGLLLMGNELNLFRVRWDMIWPVIIIAVGVVMIWQAMGGNLNFRGTLKGGFDRWTTKLTDVDVDAMAVFGGFKRKLQTKQFRGGRVVAMFGGYQLDLRNCDIEAQEATLEATSMFGGGEIRVPETWNVVIEATGIFGGYSDDRHVMDNELPPNAKKLIVRGVALFGGVEIKN